MFWPKIAMILVCSVPLLAQEPVNAPSGPTNEKAQKTFHEAQELEQKHKNEWALDAFKKADKQDGGHCVACQKKIVHYGIEFGDWKAAEMASNELIGEAQGDRDSAIAQYQFARVLLEEGLNKKKDELFSRAHDDADESA